VVGLYGGGVVSHKDKRCGDPTVKKMEDMFTLFDKIHERDGQTDGQRATA